MDTKTQLQNFCRNIHALRVSHNLSQKEMASLLGISLYMMRKIESGTVPPNATVDILFKAYKEFGITPDALLCGNFVE